ncbi:MAG: hypothetical protein HND50_00330 [Calditrichaeota bacterium]|nr:hypothetical protein [Calditrichota bacterium]
MLLWINKGKCPLTNFQKMIGDDKGFFGLILPNKAIPLVTPSYAFFTSLALVLICLVQV